ncbi:MAG: hypothetical protein F4Z15_04950 [Gammaproteobacteria bacterium]|nr:hypothetical protein [Gammaproteobacteria bacterium]MYD75870.1 hypothetical protein [Gammaproteobacteria bacterium]MYJ52456.1 hypothetical protein [Gammaproteobacteria bacterium]
MPSGISETTESDGGAQATTLIRSIPWWPHRASCRRRSANSVSRTVPGTPGWCRTGSWSRCPDARRKAMWRPGCSGSESFP